MAAEWLAKVVVEVEGYDGFRELIEVTAQDVCGIVDGKASPVKTLTVAFGRVESLL